jgi:hypothetical protein
VEGGKIYGRGAADMKGAIAALLLSLEAVAYKPLKYDTAVMITTMQKQGRTVQSTVVSSSVSGAFVFNLDSSFGYVGIATLDASQIDIGSMASRFIQQCLI